MSSGALGWTKAWLQQVLAEIIHFLEPFDLDAISKHGQMHLSPFINQCIV